MRLSRQVSVILPLVAAIACSDSFGPIKSPVYFDLANVNGQQVPAPFVPASAAVPTILSAYLILDPTGEAVMSEQRREADGSLATITNHFRYQITGKKIEIGSFSPCPANANCFGTYKGTISNDALSLVLMQSSQGSIVYNYRRTVGIPASDS